MEDYMAEQLSISIKVKSQEYQSGDYKASILMIQFMIYNGYQIDIQQIHHIIHKKQFHAHHSH